MKLGFLRPLLNMYKSDPSVSSKTEGNFCSIKAHMFNNINDDHNYALVFDDTDDIFREYQATDQSQIRRSEIVCEIKQEIIECEEPKIEFRPWDLPTKIDYNSVSENIQLFPIKKEILDIHDVDTKQNISESEVLTTYCDLPTLICESPECLDNFVQPCSSKHTRKPLKTLKTTTNVISKKKRRKQNPCPVCQKNVPSSKSRSKHINGHFGKNFVVCEFCGKLMKKIKFFRHYFIHVVKNRTKKVPSIQKHLITHASEKLFKCDVCFKKFKRKSHLGSHLFIHSDIKRLKCDICSKEFKRNFELRKHLVIHSDNKPFKCDICSKEFKRNFELHKHLAIHSDNKPFKCDICSEEFNSNSQLRKHLVISSDNKQFKCDICSKEFKYKYTLRRHVLKHPNKKPKVPFKCDICFKEFNYKSAFKRHLITHTNEKPFKCDICSKVFKRNLELQRHFKIHTNENSDGI